MSDLTYMVLKFGFLALLWVFVFVVVYALRSDLFGQPMRKLVAKAREEQLAGQQRTASAERTAAPALAVATASTEQDSTTATRLVITAGPKAGLEIDLPGEQLTIGRSSDAGLIVRDDYTSSHHARLLRWPDGWMIQDLDSTNGTFLGGSRVHGPTYVPLHTPITVGATTFELRQ